MPNTLVAEGMAQCGGLLVSEIYQFSELVVLAKFAKCTFEGEARPGDALRYHADDRAGQGFRRVGHREGRHRRPAVFARPRFSSPATMPTPPNKPEAACCSIPIDLLQWLRVVGVFDVGVRPDGTRLRAEDYPHFNSDKSH